jgi:hypothetical protein
MARVRRKAPLDIVELAVDPADVDEPRYPVRMRLTRPLTPYEVEGLALVEPSVRAEGDAVVLPLTRLDDVARDRDGWSARLERVTALAEELQGESWMADERRVARHDRRGSHLLSQQADDRGLH